MKKILITAALIIAAVTSAAVSQLMNWEIRTWIRMFLFLPPLYAGMNLRKSDAFSVAMLTFLGISPVAIEMLKRENAVFFYLAVSSIALVFTGACVGIIISRQAENSSTVSRAHEILQSLRKGSNANTILDILKSIFMEKCETENVEIFLKDGDGFLGSRNGGGAPLPENHLFYRILDSGDYFLSKNISMDKRVEAGCGDESEDDSKLLVFPVVVNGEGRGVVSVTGIKLDRVTSELISVLNAIRSSVENSLELIEKREKTIQHEIRRMKLRDNLASYVSSKYIERLLGGDEQITLGGETRYVTVMFTDIVNFRELAAEMPPGDIIAMLNEFFSAALYVVFDFDGTMDKFIGHNIMAFWGAPVEVDNPEERAVKCALELQERLEQTNALWRAAGKPEFEMSIGINSGEAVAGTIGSLRRMEYTVIGDTVNMASRIKALSKQSGIPVLVGENTFSRVRDEFPSATMLEARVKGKSEPIKVYRL